MKNNYFCFKLNTFSKVTNMFTIIFLIFINILILYFTYKCLGDVSNIWDIMVFLILASNIIVITFFPFYVLLKSFPEIILTDNAKNIYFKYSLPFLNFKISNGKYSIKKSKGMLGIERYSLKPINSLFSYDFYETNYIIYENQLKKFNIN